VLPIALLLGLLYTLTNHARHNEITAMRAAGISLGRVCLPYLGIGFLTSLALFGVNEFWAPQSDEQAERVLNRRVQEESHESALPASGLANLREGRIWMAGSYNVKTGEMCQPQVIWTLSDGSQLWLRASRAIRSNGLWTFFDAYENKAAGEVGSQPLPVLRTNILAVPEFNETPEQILSEINISRGMTLGAFKRADVPIAQILDYLRLHPVPPEGLRPWLYTKLQGRLAAPWTCLVVVLIAIPFGAAGGRRNVFVGVASSLVICVAFIVLSQFGLALGTGGFLASWLAAWLPNIAFGMGALWMIARVR
jgi:lipopolysaccharide export system permease protein